MEEEKISQMKIYFKWGGFIKQIREGKDVMVDKFFTDFQKLAMKNDFDKGVWSKSLEETKKRNTGINYNLYSKNYNWKNQSLRLEYDDYYPERGVSAGWTISLSWGGQNTKLKSLFDERDIKREIEKSFKEHISSIDLTSSLLRVRLVPGLVEKEIIEQQKIILNIWKKLKSNFEEAMNELNKQKKD